MTLTRQSAIEERGEGWEADDSYHAIVVCRVMSVELLSTAAQLCETSRLEKPAVCE